MPRPKLIDQIDLQTEIKNAAWRQIAEFGAPALTLRGIARNLHITAPAIYNYYPSRDELVTALIIDAYNSMADSQLSAIENIQPEDHGARLLSLGSAYREWAITHPQRYQLIFGTPIPGYHAPLEATMPAASRSLEPLIMCLAAAWRDGELRHHASSQISPALQQQLFEWRQYTSVPHEQILLSVMIIWSRVHGLVSLEIGNQYPVFVTDLKSVYQVELEQLLKDVLSTK